MSVSKFNVDLIKLEDIIVKEASIENKSELIKLEKNKYHFDVKNSFEMGANLELKKFKVTFKSILETKEISSKQTIDIKANFKFDFVFNVDNLEELIGKNADFENADLVLSTINIGYSTSRGIIFTKCQGTIIDKFILPILPSKNIIEMFSLKI